MEKEKTANENAILYVAIIVSALVLGWVFWSSFNSSPAANPASSSPYSPGLATGNDDCGDLTDTSNVQHLSHHPGQFADCIKKVDPAIFRQAVGKDKDAYMAESGIK